MIGDLFDSPWKILIVAVIIIVLFGSRKLPVQGLHEEDDKDEPATAQSAPVAPPAQLEASAPAPADPQEQIAALQAQLDNLQQQTVAANGSTADTQQNR